MDSTKQAFCDAVGEMTRSMSSARETIKSLSDKGDSTAELQTKDGISLLSLKHHLLLSYMQALALLCTHRVAGHSLEGRSPPTQAFSSPDRDTRGHAPGDFVDAMIEQRVVLEKIKVLEGRMRYQIDKLVRVAKEVPSRNKDIVDDPLAFKPNPQNLVNEDGDESDREARSGDDVNAGPDGIYRPPKLAPMPYTDAATKKSRRQPVPTALSSLTYQDPSRPHVESTSGLGAAPSLASTRAREIQRMNEYEEENFTRLVMKKRDAKQRKKDEEDIALGGQGGIRGKRRGGGLEDEFVDVLRSVMRPRSSAVGDVYDELRNRSRKDSALVRSRVRREEDGGEGKDEERRPRKRSRFEKEAKSIKKRMSGKARS